MNAPDKIYVLMDESTGFLSHTFTNVPCEYEGTKQDITYIRKDALLEWAKETYLSENASQIRKVCFKQLIDKLNSL